MVNGLNINSIISTYLLPLRFCSFVPLREIKNKKTEGRTFQIAFPVRDWERDYNYLLLLIRMRSASFSGTSWR